MTSINSLSSGGYTAADIAALFSSPSSSAPGTKIASSNTSSAQPFSLASALKAATVSTAGLQAIIQSSEANSEAGQSAASLVAAAYSETATASETSDSSTTNGIASENSNWMAKNIATWVAAWKDRQTYRPDADAYERGASAAIANNTVIYMPASQVSGLDVSEVTKTWTTACGGGGSETTYGYNGDTLNAFVKSQGKSGGLVIWGKTPEESTVALW